VALPPAALKTARLMRKRRLESAIMSEVDRIQTEPRTIPLPRTASEIRSRIRTYSDRETCIWYPTFKIVDAAALVAVSFHQMNLPRLYDTLTAKM